jgi:hypothetical protein
MKKIIVILVCVIIGPAFLAAKQQRWSAEDTAKYTAKYTVGKFLVIKQDGIPTTLLSTDKDNANQSGDGFAMMFAKKKTYIPVKIKIDGTWKEKGKVFGSSKSNAVLEMGEILKIVDEIDLGSNVAVEFKTETVSGHEASHKGGICGTKFIFEIGILDTFERVDERIGQVFDVFDKIEDINKKETVELKLGMTIIEVVALLKEPSKKVDLGDRIIYKYDDMVITFQEGKVINIEFK